MNKKREAVCERNTKETRIRLSLGLDGDGTQYRISTGIGFFDHMLEGFARHGFFDLDLQAEGDLQVDTHHTVEDTGIVLGTAIREAAGEKESAGTEAVSFLWMRCWASVLSIFPADHIFPGTQAFPVKKSGIWRQKQ